jgi:hypothetical protein
VGEGELFRSDGQMGRHDKDNSRFLRTRLEEEKIMMRIGELFIQNAWEKKEGDEYI